MSSNNNNNLLPTTDKEFRSKNYWEKFFKQRGTKAFEWYGEYEHLSTILHNYIKIKDSILNIGCGNSALSENMYDVGLKNITNIDLSGVVIQKMSVKNKERSEMKFIQMDMLRMDFENESFDVVLDKGTLDALMSDNSENVNNDCEKMFSEINRVLKFSGRYICVSLAQKHIAVKLLNTFKEMGWFIRIHRIDEYDLDFHLPVFVFIFTKMKMKLPSTVIEMKFDPQTEKFERYADVSAALAKIQEYQQFGLAKFYIGNKEIESNDDVFVHLYNPYQKEPRYTIYIVDLNKKLNPFAAFVVPIGKENDWLFGTKDGRAELAQQAKFSRLLVVYLNRNHKYENLNEIINELSAKVMELAPKNIPKSYKVPILSEGPDIDIRNLRYKGVSSISGDYFVEDIKQDETKEGLSRRLIFQNINSVIQTEVVLKKEKSGNLVPNYQCFTEDYFLTLVSHLIVLSAQKKEEKLKILIVGLGGGVLTMYCKEWIPNCDIDAVEIDGEIKDAAKNWFGLVENESIRLHVCDGLRYIADSAAQNKRWDVVLIDVNNDQMDSDLWCPTPAFVTKEFLNNCKSILSDHGVFIMNMICRNEALRKDILANLKSIFPKIFVNKLKKNRNEIIFSLTDSGFFKDVNNNSYEFFKKYSNNKIKKQFEEVIKNLREI